MAIAYVTTTKSTNLGAAGGASAAVDTSGCTLIVVAVSRASAGTGGTMSDSQGNSWTLLHTAGVSTCTIAWYYCLAPTTNAAHTFSYTGTNVYPSVVMAGYSGTNIGLDQKTIASNISTTTLACGSLTPANANSLIVSAQAHLATDGQGVDSSLTERQDNPRVAGQQLGAGIADIIQGVAAAINPTWSSAQTVARHSVQAVFYEVPAPPSLLILTIEDGVVERQQTGDTLTLVGPLDTAGENITGTTDVNLVPVGVGSVVIEQNTTQEASGAHLPSFTIEDNTGTSYLEVTAFTNASQNIAISSDGAGALISTGAGNFMLGAAVGGALTTGNNNTLIGTQAGRIVAGGSENTAIGRSALYSLVSTDQNTAIGRTALDNCTGSNNTAVGYQAGTVLTTGSDNVFLGRTAGQNASQSATCIRSIVIGASSYVTGDNAITIGRASNAAANSITIGNDSHIYTRIHGDIFIAGAGTNAITSSTVSTISGGTGQTITSSNGGTICGGNTNSVVDSYLSVVCGGLANDITSSSFYSFVGGGNDIDIADSTYAVACGGYIQTVTATSSFAFLGGGRGNDIAQGYAAFLGGGRDNLIYGAAATVYNVLCGGQDNQIHTTNRGFIGGGNSHSLLLSSHYSVICGGSENTGSGAQYSTIVGGQLHTISGGGTHSTITGGWTNTIDTSYYATIGGGYLNTINTGATYSTIAGGRENLISAASGCLVSGRENTIPSGKHYSTASGYQGAVSNHSERAHATTRHDSTDGSCQGSDFVLGNTTSDATVTTLWTDNLNATLGALTLPANSAWAFNAIVNGFKTDGSAMGNYELVGSIRRDGAAAATFGTLTKRIIHEDVAGWDATATASGNTLAIQVTGAAATDINWTANVRVAQVIVES